MRLLNSYSCSISNYTIRVNAKGKLLCIGFKYIKEGKDMPLLQNLGFFFFFLWHTHLEMIVRANHREPVNKLMEKRSCAFQFMFQLQIINKLARKNHSSLKFLMGTDLQFDFLFTENVISRWYIYQFCAN